MLLIFYFTNFNSLITTHDDFDSADPSRMKDACQISTQRNDFALYDLSYLRG